MLTLDNLANMHQFRNTSHTFRELFAYGCVPIVNENDTVAVEELHFGDNDTLSAKVATLVECILTALGEYMECQGSMKGKASRQAVCVVLNGQSAARSLQHGKDMHVCMCLLQMRTVLVVRS